MNQNSIKGLFELILQEQLKLGYDLRPHLNPPATIEQIAAAEAELGFKLNDGLKELYGIANGTNGTYDDEDRTKEFVPYNVFLSLEEAVAQHKYWRDEEWLLMTNWKYKYAPDKQMFPIFSDGWSDLYWADLNENSSHFGKIYFNSNLPYYSHHSLLDLFNSLLNGFKSGLFYKVDEGTLETEIDKWHEVQLDKAATIKLGDEPDLSHVTHKLSMLDILKTEAFCGVTLGFSKDQILERLGEPDSKEQPFDTEFWTYDSFDFTFEKDLLIGIGNKHFDVSAPYFNESWVARKYDCDNWLLPFAHDMPIDQCRELLMQNAIEYKEAPFLDSIEQRIGKNVHLLYGSELAFCKEPEEWQQHSEEELDWKLFAIFIS